VAVSPRLRAYLALEREMLELDDRDDPLADTLRDAMDPLWYALTDAEHAALNARDFGLAPANRATPELSAEVLEVPDNPSQARAAPLLKGEPRSASGSNLEAA
jgi:hypothetical protein